MKSIIILILSLSCVALSVNAQLVPGYQGHKNIASYQLNISPALNRPTYLNRVRTNSDFDYPLAKESLMPFNLTHTFKIERVMGRKFAMSANYSIAASKEYVSFTQKLFDPILGNDNVMNFENVKLNIYANYFTGSFIFYGKRALAPFGKYFKIDLSYVSLVSSYADESLTNSVANPNLASTVYTFNTKDIHYALNTFGLGCSFGTNRIYHKRLVINRGISLFLLTKGGGYIEDSKGMIPAMHKRMSLRDWTSFYLSAGYLF
ncbi:MAG: hypothetical protein IT236_10905 [Bacteroidia bacterium]|nr:hypothetical protein [Bacteroidia bacterium]